MRVLVSVVGKRTEHWEGFLAALARRSELELAVHAADVTDLGRERLSRLSRRAGLRFEHSPHLLGEDLTGHMASIVFRPGSWRRLRDFEPEVVHIVGEAAYLATHQTIRARNRLWPGVPITLYAAQNVVISFPYPFPWLERYAYRQIAIALPITPAAEAVLRAKGYTGPTEIVPLGVDLSCFRPRAAAPEGPFTVGFVGRLEPHKGLGTLIAAAARLNCRLLLVGDGSLRPQLEAEAARCPGRIELVPWTAQEELPAQLARMHALTLPSVATVQRNVLPWIGVPLREQFGRVLVEAMACGVPVVGTTVGEIPYVLGKSGLTVPPEDPAALAGALGRIRDRPELAMRLSEAGLERVKSFGWDRIAEQVAAAWRKLAAPPRDEKGLRWVA